MNRSSSSAGRCCRISVEVNADRLVRLAVDLVSVPSPTGDEQAMGERVRDELERMGLQVQWQQVEDGRPNVVGLWEGAGGGPSLMFNGHMDTSYSGREPWLAGIPGFQPEGFVRDGRIYGLGISNMKGALACYVEAVRALQNPAVGRGAAGRGAPSAEGSRRRHGPRTSAGARTAATAPGRA